MNRSAPPPLDGLPGAELIIAGLAELARGEETVGALLIEIAEPRLALAGIAIPLIPPHEIAAELRLYRLLGEKHGVEGYAQYNAHLRQLSSFCRALEHRLTFLETGRKRPPETGSPPNPYQGEHL